MNSVTLSATKQHEAQILELLLAGAITSEEAAARAGRSMRWVERIRPLFREIGPEALVHGNRGRRPANALTPEVARRITDLARGKYASISILELSQRLREAEGIDVSTSSVRRLCLAAGVDLRGRRRRPRSGVRRPTGAGPQR